MSRYVLMKDTILSRMFNGGYVPHEDWFYRMTYFAGGHVLLEDM